MALAVILGTLARALALTAVNAEAAALHGLGVRSADQGGAANDERGYGHGNASTRFLAKFHLPLL